MSLQPPADSDDWIALSSSGLPVEAARKWVVQPGDGAQVVFTGTVRDSADGRDGVTSLDYEAYEEHATGRLALVAGEVRQRWPSVGRIALLHRVGHLELTEVAVVVAVGAPHRESAFEAARFAIDRLKSTVPIWKRETWEGGRDWGTRAQHIEPLPSRTRQA